MNVRRLVFAAAVAAAGVTLAPSIASAHHATAVCQTPGVWAINNADGDWGNISAIVAFDQAGPVVTGGLGTRTVTVSYSGTALSGSARWENGAVGPFGGTGNCVVTTTTTTTVPATTTTTEGPSTTTSTTVSGTDPSTTTSSSSPITSTTSTTPTTTSTVPGPSTSVTSTSSSTTVPPVVTTVPTPTTSAPDCTNDPATPQDDCAPVCDPVYLDRNGDGDTLDPHESSCDTGRLPATGDTPWPLIIIGGLLLSIGVSLTFCAAASKRDEL